MTRPAQPSKVVLWVVLSLVGLFVILIGACSIYVFTNPEIKKVFGQIQKMQGTGEIAEQVREALEKHVGSNNNWPNSLSELSTELPPDVMKAATEAYEYKKPSPNDPPQTIVVWSKPTGEESELMNYRIEIEKSFKAYVITRSPLDKKRGFKFDSNTTTSGSQ